MHECYKVVSVYNGKYYSYNMSRDTCLERAALIEHLSLEYEIGKITIPTIEDSQIFAFSNYEDAEYFCNNGVNSKILKCECGKITVHNKNIPYSSVIKGLISDNKKFNWDDIMKRYCGYGIFEGTILTPWVRPIEVIQ